MPNDDVLVVGTNSPGTAPATTPKQLATGTVRGKFDKAGKGGSRITLLRRVGVGGQWQKCMFLEGSNSSLGMQRVGDYLYVTNAGDIMHYRYVPGETRIADPGIESADLPGAINRHWTKALPASSGRRELYVGVGSNSNITKNGAAIEYRYATILEVDVASHDNRIYASGLHNLTGLQWEPVSNKLWTVVNERDEIDNDLVPDYLTSIREGSSYSWPYNCFGQYLDSRVKLQRPGLAAEAIVPDYALGFRVAALGLFFYAGNELSERYYNGTFINEHGS